MDEEKLEEIIAMIEEGIALGAASAQEIADYTGLTILQVYYYAAKGDIKISREPNKASNAEGSSNLDSYQNGLGLDIFIGPAELSLRRIGRALDIVHDSTQQRTKTSPLNMEKEKK